MVSNSSVETAFHFSTSDADSPVEARVSGRIQLSIRVPPTELISNPTGTPVVCWRLVPKK
jgi:hypothetical protein